VFGTPFRWRVREGTNAVIFQGTTLDLQKTGLSVSDKRKIEPGISVLCFSPEIFDFPQTACCQPFLGGQIGRLGIHIDEAAAFPDGNQVVFCFPAGIIGLLTPDLGAGRQQFPASAGVFYVDNFCLTIDFHMGNKTVGTSQKYSGNHIAILHRDSLSGGFSVVYHKNRTSAIRTFAEEMSLQETQMNAIR
jgi:hypothetical protein